MIECLVFPPSTSDQSSEARIISYLSPSLHRVLDSLAHISLLDICSRRSDASHTHQTLFREGQVLFSAPARTSRRHSRGTTITVRDLFYNLPVRQLREADPLRLERRLKRQWEESRMVLQSFAIVHPHITFSLRNSSPQSLIGSNSPDLTSFYRISKTASSIATFGKIYGQQFVQDSTPFNLIIENFRVSGVFGKHRHSSKAIQLIYLDGVLIPPNSSVHRNLIKLFSKSTPLHVSSSPHLNSSSMAPINPHSQGVASLVDRYPVYLLLLTPNPNPNNRGSCVPSHAHFFDDREQSLIPQAEEKICRIVSVLFSKVFANVDALDSSSCSQPKSRKDSRTRTIPDSQWPVSKPSRLSNLDLARPSEIPSRLSSSSSRIASQNQPKTCSRPRIKSKSWLSKPKSYPSTCPETSKSLPNSSCFTSSVLHNVPNHSQARTSLRSKFEYKPQNRFAFRPENIDSKLCRAGSSSFTNHQPEDSQRKRKKQRLDGEPFIENEEEMELQVDLSKLLRDPCRFSVIGQLDLKFIIVKVVAENSEASILAFDQHAAHERIRVERYLQEICSVNLRVKKLKTSIDSELHRETIGRVQDNHDHQNLVPILVNRTEYDGLLKFQKHFNRWGFIYKFKSVNHLHQPSPTKLDEDEEDEDSEFKQVFMLAIPEMISYRIRCDDDGLKLLADILRGCLGFFEDRNRDGSLQPSDHHHHQRHTDWFGLIKDCPTVLVDLLNSKACRGSIMFGDELTNGECRKLLLELGQTKLPFSCAHGRPTCHPLFKFPRSSLTSTSGKDSQYDHNPPLGSVGNTHDQHPSPSTPTSSHDGLAIKRPRNLVPLSGHPYHKRKINWESLALG